MTMRPTAMSALIEELAADYTNLQSELLSVHLTKAEHLAVLGALNRVTGMATGDGLAALEGLARAFEENIEGWDELSLMKRGRAV